MSENVLRLGPSTARYGARCVFPASARPGSAGTVLTDGRVPVNRLALESLQPLSIHV